MFLYKFYNFRSKKEYSNKVGYCHKAVESIADTPNETEIHIQKTAPGPPIAIAPTTPAILPVPTVAARAVQTAWKGVRAPLDISEFSNLNSSCANCNI